MHIQRTAHDNTSARLGATPTFININSHWWDACKLTAITITYTMKIRSKRDGKIKFDGEMLLEDPDIEGVDFTGFNDNWWIGLALLHNLFARYNTIPSAMR